MKAWKSICLLKCDGGLGIRLFSEFNKALVFKLAWKMISDRNILWVRVMHGKCVKGRDFWHVGARGQVDLEEHYPNPFRVERGDVLQSGVWCRYFHLMRPMDPIFG